MYFGATVINNKGGGGLAMLNGEGGGTNSFGVVFTPYFKGGHKKCPLFKIGVFTLS